MVNTGNSVKGHNARAASCIQLSKCCKVMLMQAADVHVLSSNVAKTLLNAAHEVAGAVRVSIQQV